MITPGTSAVNCTPTSTAEPSPESVVVGTVNAFQSDSPAATLNVHV